MSTDRVAVILGAGPGLGSSLARKFSTEGYKVALVSRTRRKLEKIQKDIDGKISIYPADVTNEQELITVFKSISKQLGKNIDILIYNAGEFKMQSILEIKSSDFKKSWEINCYGAFLSSKLVLPSMLKRKKGTIIFTGATASMRGGAMFYRLAVGKFGLRALAQSLAREFGPEGIHVVHTIIDGQIASPGYSKKMPEREMNSFLSPDSIAEQYWQIHIQEPTAWTHELDLRPFVEHF